MVLLMMVVTVDDVGVGGVGDDGVGSCRMCTTMAILWLQASGSSMVTHVSSCEGMCACFLVRSATRCTPRTSTIHHKKSVQASGQLLLLADMAVHVARGGGSYFCPLFNANLGSCWLVAAQSRC